jgi:hypothetical protein
MLRPASKKKKRVEYNLLNLGGGGYVISRKLYICRFWDIMPCSQKCSGCSLIQAGFYLAYSSSVASKMSVDFQLIAQDYIQKTELFITILRNVK